MPRARKGKQPCAVTTSIGTLLWGIPKLTSARLTAGGKADRDRGRFSLRAGRVRLHGTGKSDTVEVKLDRGADRSCSSRHKTPVP